MPVMMYLRDASIADSITFLTEAILTNRKEARKANGGLGTHYGFTALLGPPGRTLHVEVKGFNTYLETFRLDGVDYSTPFSLTVGEMKQHIAASVRQAFECAGLPEAEGKPYDRSMAVYDAYPENFKAELLKLAEDLKAGGY